MMKQRNASDVVSQGVSLSYSLLQQAKIKAALERRSLSSYLRELILRDIKNHQPNKHENHH